MASNYKSKKNKIRTKRKTRSKKHMSSKSIDNYAGGLPRILPRKFTKWLARKGIGGPPKHASRQVPGYIYGKRWVPIEQPEEEPDNIIPIKREKLKTPIPTYDEDGNLIPFSTNDNIDLEDTTINNTSSEDLKGGKKSRKTYKHKQILHKTMKNNKNMF